MIRVLQICNKPPFPPVDGGCVAMNNITEGLLHSGVEVVVLAINTPKHPCNINTLPEKYIRETSFKTVFINTNINPIKAFISVFKNISYNIDRFYSKKFNEFLISVLKEKPFDIIQLESLYVAPYINTIKQYSKGKIVLRAHNVEHKLWERKTQNEISFVRKIIFAFLTKKIKKQELSVTSNVDGVAAITDIDKEYFEKLKPSVTIPLGINTDKYKNYTSNYAKKDLFFIGALDWQPNSEGLFWFIKNVWTNIKNKYPDTTFYIAGKNTPSKLKQLNSKILNVLGEVPNAIEYMNEHNIMIVPVFWGGGMRIKIIEGMAMGKTIITTTLGAEGIACKNDHDILIANTADEFITQINSCLNNSEYCKQIGQQAKKNAIENYNNEIITKRLIDFYKKLVN